MSFYAFYPPSSGSINASIGTNGSTAPTSSTEVGGINPSGNLQPLQTNAAGALITTPVAGSVQHVIVDSSALPTGASTLAAQTTGNASLSSIDTKLTSPLTVTGPLTDTQLRATAVPVSGTVAVTGVATAANQATQITSLSSINTAIITKMSGSLVPVAFDEVALTYVPSGAGVGQVATAVYKLAASTVKTLTMSYDGSDRLSDVVAS